MVLYFLSILLGNALSLLFLSCPAGSKFIDEGIDHYHYLYSVGSDTLFFASTVENSSLNQAGRGLFFLARKDEQLIILKKIFFEDAYAIKYLVGDFDNDGKNELLTIDLDEAYYDISIFGISYSNRRLVVTKLFEKKNLFIPQGHPHSLIGVRRDGGAIKYLTFQTEIKGGRLRTLHVKYDKNRMRYILY